MNNAKRNVSVNFSFLGHILTSVLLISLGSMRLQLVCSVTNRQTLQRKSLTQVFSLAMSGRPPERPQPADSREPRTRSISDLRKTPPAPAPIADTSKCADGSVRNHSDSRRADLASVTTPIAGRAGCRAARHSCQSGRTSAPDGRAARADSDPRRARVNRGVSSDGAGRPDLRRRSGGS